MGLPLLQLFDGAVDVVPNNCFDFEDVGVLGHGIAIHTARMIDSDKV